MATSYMMATCSALLQRDFQAAGGVSIGKQRQPFIHGYLSSKDVTISDNDAALCCCSTFKSLCACDFIVVFLCVTLVGLSFQDFYQRCREAFLVNSDLTLRTQLTEFRDHKLIRTRKVDPPSFIT